jgi:catechol 2,3-dioxygenase-like lactoylglutathione lyase family enzyme
MNRHAEHALVPGDYAGTSRASDGFHVGLNVPDMDVALGFYRDLLGLEVAWRHAVSGQFLEDITGIPGAQADVVHLVVPGGSRLELTCYAPTGSQVPSRQNDVGLTHLSLGVDDVEGVQARLEKAGVTFASKATCICAEAHPLDGWTVTYLSDPFGTTIELLGKAP